LPLLENDTLFAFLDKNDDKHSTARRVFSKLERGELSVDASSVALVEMALVYKSEEIEDRLLGDLAAVAAFPNVSYVAFTPDVAVASAYIRSSQGLSFFDSHYAAAALALDGKIISFDRAYDKVPGLTRIDPAEA
jgi:predicted nucleic acid-binding protein